MVNNFINGKSHSSTVLYKDDIAVYTCDHSFLTSSDVYRNQDE